MGEAPKPLAPEPTALPQGYIPAFSRLPAKTADSPSRHPALADGGSTSQPEGRSRTEATSLPVFHYSMDEEARQGRAAASIHTEMLTNGRYM